MRFVRLPLILLATIFMTGCIIEAPPRRPPPPEYRPPPPPPPYGYDRGPPPGYERGPQ